MLKTIEKLQSLILTAFYFLFPLFFLPFTPEPFATNKFYLVILTGLLLLALSTVSLIVSRKITWNKTVFDSPIMLFLLTILISLVFSSQNKISGALNISYGIVSIFFFTVIFFYTSALKNKREIFRILNLSALIAVILSIASLLQPLKNVPLPQQLGFMKSPYFSPIGGRVDLIVISLFMAVLWGVKIFYKLKNKVSFNKLITPFIFFVVYLISIATSLFSVIKPLVANFTFNLPTYRHSWYASVEILKSLKTALFGVGVDNFSFVFGIIRDISFNQTALWDNVINASRSTFLHVFTTTGLLGLIGFVSILFAAYTGFKKLDNDNKKVLYPLFLFIVLVLLLSTPTIVTFFLFFTLLALINSEILKSTEASKRSYDFKELVPVHVALVIILVFFIGSLSYIFGRVYAASYLSTQSIYQLQTGNLSNAYRDLRNAIIQNPYNESYRSSFAQTNLLIADAIIRNARKDLQPNQQLNLSENERLQVSQAIQQSISEAKTTVTLNPQSAQNWANLGIIYTNLLNVTQGSDVWAISSYQRAITLDSKNPLHRMRLGSLYYVLGNYEDATQLFTQAVSLKPDFANAHYNLGWSLYQQKQYQAAANQIQAVMKLLENDKNSQDYKNAKETYENFKKQVELTQQQEQEAAQGEELNLPQQQTPQIQPKIDLPESASPEAK